MNFFNKLFKKEQKESPKLPEQPLLVKEEAKMVDPVQVRTDEALAKLIAKIREKHFSPEIQKTLKEMKGPLGNCVVMRIIGRNGLTNYRTAEIKTDNISLGYSYTQDFSLYNYKHEYVNECLLDIIEAYEEVDYEELKGKIITTRNLYKKVSEKLFIEHLCDYFFNGQLEKDIEKLRKTNRDYETRKEKERTETADRLCELTKD